MDQDRLSLLLNQLKLLFTHNPMQKVVAICLAVMVWVAAPTPESNELTEVQFVVPVTYSNLPKEVAMISKPPQSVAITVEVAKKDITKVTPGLFPAIIDLEGGLPGKQDFRITAKNFLNTPADMRVTKISPDSISITFEKVTEKTLPIQPVFVGEPASEYVVQKVTMHPETVRVSGPEGLLAKLDQLETRALDIKDLNADVDMLAHPIFPEGVRALPPVPEFYTARIEVGSEPVSLRFDGIPIGLVNQVFVTRINPKSFNVLLRGPKNILDSFSKIDIQAFIDLSKFQPGKYKVKEPTFRLPAEIQIQKVWPPIDVWVLNQKIYE